MSPERDGGRAYSLTEVQHMAGDGKNFLQWQALDRCFDGCQLCFAEDAGLQVIMKPVIWIMTQDRYNLGDISQWHLQHANCRSADWGLQNSAERHWVIAISFNENRDPNYTDMDV